MTVLPGIAAADTILGRVVGVTDGDTISVVAEENRQFKVRLAGIDAPEKKQPFGQKSKAMLAEKIYGKQVVVEWNKRDRYQRIVGKVVADGSDVGLSLISSGLAWHYKKYESEQTQEDRRRYSDAEVLARSNRLGVWSEENPTPPWVWRSDR